MMEHIIAETEEKIAPVHQSIDRRAEQNTRRVLESFRKHKVSEAHFHPSTGYGYDDAGRDTLEKIYADVFGGEAAIVRPQIISGTHAIATALFGVLRPGDELLYITGKPYDTLEEIVGVRGKGKGSLREFGVSYRSVPLREDGNVNIDAVESAISEKTKVIGIQRSRGYEERPSFTIADIEYMISAVKRIKPDIITFVDNCYGEFAETKEPCHIGADLIAGSLIKNPGGGLAKTGGYITGRKPYVELSSYRLTAPGIGREAGASLYSLPEMYHGFFLAPHTVGQALKGAVFTAALLERLGFSTAPAWDEERTDLIQAVKFGDAKVMADFCRAIQASSPVNAHVTPHPGPMPGYEDEIIMAAGTFVQGASIELSADGPLRPPYTAYVQGGLTYEHVKIAVSNAAAVLQRNVNLSNIT
ncbi:MAG TPA: methionine gamma-lyase family protein [Bacillales bacterium]|nr:methionine gamma-lyase family protein [Bacillales bacterium]